LHAPGTFIEGKYEILGKIREGGMGAIYKVRHRLLDEVRVIKVMRPQVLANEELKQRFVEEAKTATRLKHPNICTIHDFALDEDGTAYLVMEFIDGVTLAELGRTPTPIPVTLEIASQALQALGYLHRRNVVHRDVAPDNLMLTTNEEGQPLVKLIDLGIAKALDRPGEMTSTGVFLGKLKYASPEQYGALPPGEKIDGRSDLYCLGVVIYELLTGVRPFTGDTPAQMLRAHLFESPLAFDQSDPNGRVPPELRAVILKALEKKREDRYANAEEFSADIQRVRERLASATDADSTIAFVSRARATVDVGGSGITPSAQDRLDRRFGAHSTPSPSRPSSTAGASGPPSPPSPPSAPSGQPRMSRMPTVVGLEKTTSLTPPPQPPASAARLVTTEPLPVPRRSRLPYLAAAALLVVAAVVAYGIRRGSRQAAPAAEAGSGAAPAPTAEPASSGAPPPVPATAAPIETRASAPVLAPTESPTSPPPALPPAVRAAHTPRPRPTPEPRRPSQVVARGPDPTAVRAVPVPIPAPPTPVPQVVVPPTAAPRIPPTNPPSPPVEAPAERAVPAESRPTAASDADRVRDAIRRWERAQNTLDAEAYTRVFPRADRARIQAAFDGFRSQTVTFEQIRVDVAPGASRATVRLFEKRVAVPRVGAEQRAEGNRTVSLRKDGDTWVITEVQ